MRTWSLFAIALAVSVGALAAATPSIGVALSSGSMTVDNALVPGNATLFNGNMIETGATSSRLQLKDGKLAQLDADSSAKVYSDHMVLQKGSGETFGSYGVVARSLRIAGDSARVSIYGNTVQVAALSAPVTVANSAGVQVANLMPGRALAFTPQESGAMAPATITGVVRKVGTNFILTDTTSNVTIQLVGGGIEKYVGHDVTVTGTPGSTAPVAGATQVLTVTNVEDHGKRKAGAGAVAAAAGAGVGASTAAIVIAGVAVAASIGVSAGILATQTTSTTAVCLSACQ
jgi:hypothetical protein